MQKRNNGIIGRRLLAEILAASMIISCAIPSYAKVEDQSFEVIEEEINDPDTISQDNSVITNDIDECFRMSL